MTSASDITFHRTLVLSADLAIVSESGAIEFFGTIDTDGHDLILDAGALGSIACIRRLAGVAIFPDRRSDASYQVWT